MRSSSCRQDHALRVIIIGCSVAGLTLAHALAKRRIDYTILEAHGRLPQPFTGNAFTLLPNGSRILAQLGVWEEIVAASDTIHSHSTFLEDGRLLERIDVERLLSMSLEDKHRVFFGKCIMALNQSSSQAKVECADGSIFTGDLVVGADGIHSVSRGEILRCLTSEYSGIYGISRPVPGLSPGHAHRTYGNGFSFIVNIGKENIFWLLSFHAGKVYCYPDIPRHSQDRASIDQQVSPFLGAHVSSNVRFEELYCNAITYCHVALEEFLCEKWAAGKLVSIGDSVHKVWVNFFRYTSQLLEYVIYNETWQMTPNLAQGANCAIESSASLANCIVRTVDQYESCARPDNPEKDMGLEAWEESRKQRMRRFYTYSWILARCEAFSGPLFKALGLYIGSFHGEQVISYISDISPESEYLEYLPRSDYHLKSRSEWRHNSVSEARNSIRSSTDDLFFPRAAKGTFDAADASNEESYWHSAPLALALLPAIAGVFFQNGSAVVTDVTLLVLAAIFLNWSYVRDWYRSAQAIRQDKFYDANEIPVDIEIDHTQDAKEDSAPAKQRATETASAASRELQIHEIVALASCFIFPLIGTWLLHGIRSKLSRPSEGLVSNYNLTIFLLASEIRPFAHLLRMVQARTLHLQRVVASSTEPPKDRIDASKIIDLSKRLEELEAHIAETAAARLAPSQEQLQPQAQDSLVSHTTTEVRKSVQPDIDALNRAVRRYEKRTAMTSFQTDSRIEALEGQVRDAISLVAAAQRPSVRKPKNSVLLLLEWLYTLVMLPAQVFASLAVLPFHVARRCLRFVQDIFLSKANPQPKLAKGKLPQDRKARSPKRPRRVPQQDSAETQGLKSIREYT
ncbi:hypothetical protein APSETT444_007198 [Aspergillus pseudonomiae]